MGFITELNKYRRQQYEYHFKHGLTVKGWKGGPHSFLKGRLFMEASALLVCILSKTRIRANALSVAYGLVGLAGGVLLAVSTKTTIIIAICIFFFKGIFDWSDGHLARVRDESSITGAILDPYGALLGSLAFQMGMGFYLAQKSGMILFYYLTALIPLLYAARITSFAYNSFFYGYVKLRELKGEKNRDSQGPGTTAAKRYKTFYNSIKYILDDNDRTIDFICFLLLLEIFTPVFITWIIFLGFVIKQLLIFCASLYLVAKGGWLERRFRDKVTEISAIFNDKDKS